MLVKLAEPPSERLLRFRREILLVAEGQHQVFVEGALDFGKLPVGEPGEIDAFHVGADRR